MHHITEILPDTIKRALSGLGDHEIDQIEEIRVRTSRPLELVNKGKPRFLPYVATPEDSALLLNRLGNYSMYTLEEELKKDMSRSEADTAWGLPAGLSSKTGPSKESEKYHHLIFALPKKNRHFQTVCPPFISKLVAEHADYRSAANRKNNTAQRPRQADQFGKRQRPCQKSGDC